MNQPVTAPDSSKSQPFQLPAHGDKKPPRQLNAARFQLAMHARNEWVVNAEEGTSMEEVLDPIYWAHIAEQLRPYDEITVRAEEGTWLAKLLVKRTGRGYAIVHLLSEHKLEADVDESVEQQYSKYEVKWKGPQRKHCVIRKSDSQLIREGFDTRQGALNALTELERAA